MLYRQKYCIVASNRAEHFSPGQTIKGDCNVIRFSRGGVEYHERITRCFNSEHPFRDPALIRIDPHGSRRRAAIRSVHLHKT